MKCLRAHTVQNMSQRIEGDNSGSLQSVIRGGGGGFGGLEVYSGFIEAMAVSLVSGASRVFWVSQK